MHCGKATPTEPGVPQRTMPTGEFEVAKVRRVLAERYRIDRVIGEGGMATVYLAEDLKHKRQVAVKVMRPELAATLGADRFLREVEIAAQLNHPHILPMYDSGEADGVLYYVMPYVDGESLAARISREGELPVPVAMRLAREIAEALAYAHKRGIIHRDIKPANILLHEGHALVADFGIARALDAEGAAITKTGLAIGTPQYMSPEQSTGEKNVDARTDIYALGAVLYEMLTGEPPFTGRTPQAVVTRSLTERPRPLGSVRDGVPAGLESAVNKALARSAADRFTTAGDLADSLSTVETGAHVAPASATPPTRSARRGAWLALGAVALLVVIGAGLMARRAKPAGAEVSGVTHLAVLPFQNQGDSSTSYIVDGLTDEVRGKLSKVSGLAVTASASSSQYRSGLKPPSQVADELGVQYLLMGRVRWAGDEATGRRLQVVTELVDNNGATAWQQTFDANLTDVFAVQGEVATRVAGALGTQLGAREAADLGKRPTENSAAWDAYLKGRAISDNNPVSQRQKVNYFEQAVALDSGFVEAWASLSTAAGVLFVGGGRDPAVARRAREAMDRALLLGPDNAFSVTAAAVYYASVERDPQKNASFTERAMQLAPNDSRTLRAAARADQSAGDYDRAIERLERAREVDPRSIEVLSALSQVYLHTGRLQDAEEVAGATIELAPDAIDSYKALARIKLAAGDLNAAKAAVARLTERVSPPLVAAHFAGFEELTFLLDPSTQALVGRLTPSAFDGDRSWWGQSLATHYWTHGRKDLARAFADSSLAAGLEQVLESPDDPSLLVLYGVALAHAGRSDSAIATGRRAVAMYRTDASGSLAYDQLQLIRIYIVTGHVNEALDVLEEMWKHPTQVTRAWARIDPLFEPLRGNARFERMVARE